MKFIIGVLTISVVVTAVPLEENSEAEWHLFKARYNKSYDTFQDEYLRKEIFELNYKRVIQHNEGYAKGFETFMMGINRFSDMLPEEVNRLHGPEGMDENTYRFINAGYYEVPKNVKLPASVDWRLKGAVTPVKNQKHCGSCWAFSSIGVLEGQNFLKSGKLVSLSEQNLIDCVSENHGCNAGRPHRALDYARVHGVDTEASYPYEQKTGKCRYNKTHVGTSDVGAYLRVPKGDEQILKAAVALAGPVLVSIDSKHPSFHGYKGGVYYEKHCSKTQTHHSVLLVGYGTTENGRDYWIVKNSWGEHWGENGYIRMSRNRGNNCNIAKFPLVPVV